MTETEKRYKVLKKTSYNAQISNENKTITLRTFLFGIASLATICAVANATRYTVDTELSTRIIEMTLGMIDTTYAAYNLKKMIESISTKTMLKNRIEDIDDELEISKQIYDEDKSIKTR